MIELLVVISIIAILAGLIMPALSGAQKSAYRASNDSNMKNIVTGIVAATLTDTSSVFSGNWANPISTVGSDNVGVDFTESGNAAVISTNNTKFQIFKDFRAKHPFDEAAGYYMFRGSASGNAKTKSDSSVRILGESYKVGNGDGRGGIGFADGHVTSTLELPSGNATAEPAYLDRTGEPVNNL